MRAHFCHLIFQLQVVCRIFKLIKPHFSKDSKYIDTFASIGLSLCFSKVNNQGFYTKILKTVTFESLRASSKFNLEYSLTSTTLKALTQNFKKSAKKYNGTTLFLPQMLGIYFGVLCTILFGLAQSSGHGQSRVVSH